MDYGLFRRSCYKRQELGGKENTIFWRLVDKELEAILVYKTTSWVGFGWRPFGIKGTCQDFPVNNKAGSGGGGAEPEPGSKSAHNTHPRAAAAAATKPEPEPEPQQPGNKNGTSGVKGAPEPEPESGAGAAEKSHLHAMDCTDLTIGSAKGPLSRVGDFYTRDRSTPLEDEVYGGSNNDLTAAYGRETPDGYTIVMFRKPLNSKDKADHSLEGKLHAIWAKGQTQGAYKHGTDSGLEVGKASVKNYYTDDVLKYHGSENRGVSVVSFTGSGRSGRDNPDDSNTQGSDQASASSSVFFLGITPVWVGFLWFCSARLF
jgi:hypothetical protein